MPVHSGRVIASLPALFALTSVTSVHAQPIRLDDIVVTAQRSEQPAAETLADITVIDRERIEQAGATGVADLLARSPGIELARNGGPTATTSLYVRGADSRFTAVYVDGVRVDSQSTGGAAWEAIPLSRIERIEILRGPAAAVYGSDAIAGVIQIFTRKGEGAFAPVLSAGVGSQRTGRVEASASQGGELVDWAAGISREISDGFNARRLASANPDDDGYRRSSANARVGLRPVAGQRLDATLLWTSLDSQYDGSRSADDHSRHHLLTTGLAWSAELSPDWTLRANAGESHTRYETRPSPYFTDTRLRNYLLDSEWRTGPARLRLGAERREDRLDNTSVAGGRGERSQNAVLAGAGLELGAHALQANARVDDDSEFGGKTNGSLAWGWKLAPAWRLSASFGTAFRAPTLYQRYSQYGVATLDPETSRNLEFGLRMLDGADQAGVVVYRNRVTNLINFGAAGPCASSFGCYGNTGHAEMEGATFSGATRLGAIDLAGSLDWQLPRDTDSGRLLARRSRLHGNVTADTRVADWTLGASLQASGRRWDNAANTQALGGYALLGVHASRRIARDWTVLARVDNLADRDYETARTYANPGRTAWLNLTWAPR
ncbi:TonB-dependent receptor domain-containing protein [Derxia gummosa]|uniref:TonB-dependent receptor domain-containing protein n=1 Tax=Derxia gummosa DSM 723 TaxID=1121388 RepID=A0A8B6X7M7_9BURK|nr:TonB-dependent receptor [Derxia gummosa]